MEIFLPAFAAGLCFWQWLFNEYDEYKEKERHEAWQRKYDKWRKEWYEPYLEKHRKEMEEVHKKWAEEDREFQKRMGMYAANEQRKKIWHDAVWRHMRK